jgi:beta-N-acetylhexosaminidase
MMNWKKKRSLNILLVPLVFALFSGIDGSRIQEVPYPDFQYDACINSTLKNQEQNFNDPLKELTRRKQIETSLTVLINKNTLPINGLDSLKIASVSIGGDSITDFQKMLGNYTAVENFVLPKTASPEDLENLKTDLYSYNLIVCGIHKIEPSPDNNFGITGIQTEAVKQFVSAKKTILVFFGNAYALKYFSAAGNVDGLVMAYEDSKSAQELSAQLLFGAFDASGKLPVSIDENFKVGSGLPLYNIGRLKYTLPEEVGINSEKLNQRIDELAQLGIEKKAYPGCQVLIAKDGKIIFHKCYGFLTYKNEIPVSSDNLYDLASITKITGPLPALMKLNSEGKFNLDAPLSKYLPELVGSNKEKIIIRDLLSHQAKLQAWLPFWQINLKKNGKLNSTFFKDHPTEEYNLRISNTLYLKPGYRDTIFAAIKDSPLLPRKKYVYSDLGFILFPSIIENLIKMDYETYLKTNFYHPLGAYSLTYNPYKYYPIGKMVPTEFDDSFRKEQIQGFVHDESAAMLGGISGNAGLFATVNDMAKLMQMYMQKGIYGGKRYIPEKTVNEFIRCQFPKTGNRRALGFDKPYIKNNQNKLSKSYPATDAGKNSFGHSGFTGTFIWADPDYNILFIFFTNRVYPTRENSELTDLNLRVRMHQAIYDCIKRKP